MSHHMECKYVHSDERGHIASLVGISNHPELVFVKTLKGFARGGCVHETDETVLVIEGSIILNMDYSTPKRINAKWLQMDAGDESIIIPANVPHYFQALEDSVVLEFGPDNEFTQKDYKMRQTVDKINLEVS